MGCDRPIGRHRDPPTVEALVGARLDALGHEDRQVIDPASVIGLGFAVEAVTNLVPEDAIQAVPSRLASLTTKQFVRPTVADEEYYRFGHAVIKDAAYRSLLKRTRAELHEHFVDWAEPINRERGREIEFEEILGYHLEQAYRYRTELGAVDGRAVEVGRRGASKLSSAGRRALTRGDMPTAAIAAPTFGRSPAAGGPSPDRGAAGPRGVAVLRSWPGRAGQGDRQGGRGRGGRHRRCSAGRAGRDRADPCRAVLGVVNGAAARPGSPSDAVLEEHDDQVRHRARLAPDHQHPHHGGPRTRTQRLWPNRRCCHAEMAGDERLVLRGVALYASMSALGPTPVDEAIERCERMAVRAQVIAARRRSSPGSLRRVCDAGLVRSCPRALSARRGTSCSSSVRASWPRQRPSMVHGSSSGGDLDLAEEQLRRDYSDSTALDETYYRSTIAGRLARILPARRPVRRQRVDPDRPRLADERRRRRTGPKSIGTGPASLRLLGDADASGHCGRAVYQSAEMADLEPSRGHTSWTSPKSLIMPSWPGSGRASPAGGPAGCTEPKGVHRVESRGHGYARPRTCLEPRPLRCRCVVKIAW